MAVKARPAGRQPAGQRTRGRARAAAAALAAAVTLLAAGCATIPSQGLAQSTPAPPGGSETSCCGLIMRGPQPNWDPTDIVSGFLLTSASFAHDHAIAREYLTPEASKQWRPGSAVAIVDQAPTVVTQTRRIGAESTVTVVASGHEIGMLTSSGQYQAVTGNKTAQQLFFSVARVGRGWRIATLPLSGQAAHELLLPEGVFNLVYQPENLYFHASGRAGQVLVPAPVFVPSESSDPVTRLVRALMSGPPSWLMGAATSAFPARARLRGVQILPGPPVNKTAIISLSLPPQAVREETLRALDAQLVWTLTSRAYGSALVQAVKLKVNGRVWPAAGGAVLGLADYLQWVPQPASAQDLYYVGGDGRIRMLGTPAQGSDAVSTPIPGAAGQGQVPLGSIAVSADKDFLAGLGHGGRTVYISDLGAANVPHAKAAVTAPHPRFTGSEFTTPSWDRADNLWVAGRAAGSAGVWVLPQGATAPLRVSLPPLLGTVTAVKVAPDGVRLAMIVGHGAGAYLVLGAIVRTGPAFAVLHTLPVGSNLSGVSAFTWYDADHLLAVTGTAANTRVWEVPVNGNAATSLGAVQPGIDSIAAAGPDNPLYLGLSTGQLERQVGFGGFWSAVTPGRDATYPG